MERKFSEIMLVNSGFIDLDRARWKCGSEFMEFLSSEYTRRAGECIGECACWGDDRGGPALGKAEAGARVDDVGVPEAVDLDVLFEVAGGGDGAVAQGDLS